MLVATDKAAIYWPDPCLRLLGFGMIILIHKCSNLIYTICGHAFGWIPVRSEGEYRHIRLSDRPEAVKKSRRLDKRFPVDCYRLNLNTY